jgi:acyl-coenzyme A thioesterase PaaI-like protein
MTAPAFQDLYPEGWSHCFGCGRLNEKGHHIRTFWDGDETVCTMLPEPWQIALPGYAYGGYLASLIDCHSTGSAAGALHRAARMPADQGPYPRCVTASLKVDYVKPTPLGPPIEMRSTIVSVKGRKVVVATSLRVNGEECVRGEAVLIQVPENAFQPVTGP